jgi:hypothetical protein
MHAIEPEKSWMKVALQMVDWSSIADRAEITVFNDHGAEPDALVERLWPFGVICVMWEQVSLRREVIERVPRLHLIASTDNTINIQRQLTLPQTYHTPSALRRLTYGARPSRSPEEIPARSIRARRRCPPR